MIFSCYTYDVKTGKIYYEEKPFNKYAKIVRLKKKALFTFDPKKDLVDCSREIAKKKKNDYDIHVEPVKLWGCMPPTSKEDEWKKEYPNIWKEPYKTVSIEELKKKYKVGDETNNKASASQKEEGY